MHIRRVASPLHITAEHSPPTRLLQCNSNGRDRFRSTTIARDDRATDVAHAHAVAQVHPASPVSMHPMDCPVKSVTSDRPDHRPANIVNNSKLSTNVHAKRHPVDRVRPVPEVSPVHPEMLVVVAAAMVSQARPAQWARPVNPVETATPAHEVSQVRPARQFQAKVDHQAAPADRVHPADPDLVDLPDHPAVTVSQASQVKWDPQAVTVSPVSQAATDRTANRVAAAVTALAITAHRHVWHRDTEQRSVGYRTSNTINNHSFQSKLQLDNHSNCHHIALFILCVFSAKFAQLK